MTQHRLPGISRAGRAALGLATAVSLTATAFVAPSYAAPPATPHISEIHYDNASTDTGEAIEVQALAGTDLTDWSLVLYNGNGGAPYGTLALSGVVPEAGVVVVDAPDLQNGSPDGIALVDAAGAVEEFLSYEGTVTAVGGPADGATSVDIGVSQPGDTPVGQSLQLIDGLWTGPATSSFGATNTGDGGPVEVAFISEIHYDNDGADTGEAIEVQAPAGTDLTGWSLVLYNGNDGAVYDTLTLSGVVPEAGVLVQEAVGMQNGSPDGVALVDAAGVLVEFLSYEGTFTAVAGPASGVMSTDLGVSEPSNSPAGQSLQLIDGAWTGPAPSSFGAINTEVPVPPAVCGDPDDPIALISDIQGSDATFDPSCSGVQTVEAVVTAIKPGLSGFYLQEEAADTDGDATTSEGIFVFVGDAGIPNSLKVGRTVRVTATVGEFARSGSSQTQLTDPRVEILNGTSLEIEPTSVTFPVATTTTLEQYEGMLVKLVDTLVISEYFNYDRFGEVVLAKPLDGLDRLHTPTAVVEPGPAAQELFSEYERRVITLDDYNSSQNPITVPHPGNGEPFSADNTFRGGDTVTGVEGVIDHTFGLYRIQPTTYGEYEAVNPRPTEAPEVGGSVQVASFNVLNYFLTLDAGAAVCGANQSQDCRGANTAEELERQRTKILAAMAELDADVFGLMEMENTPGVEPAADLVAGLNDIFGEGTYDYIDTGVIGTDAIRLGFIYKPGVLTPVGDFEILDSSDDPDFIDTANRPMLTQTFDEVATGERFTLSVNHLKSKGSACADDPDTGDGAGNCNQTRTAAAQAIVDFLASDPTNSGDPDHLVIGDLNSYDHEDPIDVLVGAGYTDLVKKYGGEHAYGYVFDGMVGYLDHALSNASLTPQVTGAAEWHINADEPDILDYNLDFGRSAAFYSPDMYRSSDHDPVLVGLELDGPVADTTAPTLEIIADPAQIWPPNNKWVTVNTVVNAEDDVDENVTFMLDGDPTAEGRRSKIETVSDSTFRVRAAKGAVYTITYKATDDAGNTTTESVTVTVTKPTKEKRSR